MIEWIISRIWWFGWRTVVTLICVWTIQNIIHMEEGYFIPFHTLLVAAIALIIGMRVWQPSNLSKDSLFSSEDSSRKVISIPIKREPRSPSEVFKNPPNFSSTDEDKSSW